MTTRATTRKRITARSRQTGRKLTEPVTVADLYEFDVRLGDRFTTIQDSINGLHDRQTAHEQAHTAEDRSNTAEKELRLDTKKVGLVGVIVTFIGAVVAGVLQYMQHT